MSNGKDRSTAAVKKAGLVSAVALAACLTCFSPGVSYAQQAQAALDEYFKLGVEYVQTGKFEDAEKMFKKVIEFDPNYVDAHVKLGNIYMLRNNFQAAQEQFLKVISIVPNNDEAHLNIGLIFMRNGALSKAIEMFQRAAEINSKSHNALYKLAECYILFNSPANAETAIKKALEIKPGDIESRIILGKAYSMQKKYGEAKKIFDEIIAADAVNFDAINESGIICYNSKEYEKAISYFEKVKSNKNLEKSAKIYYAIALCNEKLNKAVEARAAYGESIKRNPNYAAVRSDYGSFLFNAGMVNEAQFQFKEAITIDPDFTNAAVNLAKTYYVQRRYDEAREILADFAAKHPKDALIYDQLGLAYYSKREYEKAKTAFDLAIENEPTLASAHYNLGILYDEVKKYDNAVSEYKLALLFDKSHILAMNNLGYLYLNLRKFNEAAEILKKAIDINPKFTWAHYNLALAYYNIGRKEDALASYEKVIEYEEKESDLYMAAVRGKNSIKGHK